MEEEERMDADAQVAALNKALRLQYRSVLQMTLTGGSLTGWEGVGLAARLEQFARDDLDDARRLVEKVRALGGAPTAEVAPLAYEPDPHQAVAALIDAEAETLEALQDAIAPTGREAASEAVEHRLEHVIMRKQEQVDVLLRARA
ncbi:MAG TPA: ferritin-like domain-containing protein [Thermoleophilaceae bacterium]|nr:ferritin-like domain-containing protein [Thermoleophilaceae bacterium]